MTTRTVRPTEGMDPDSATISDKVVDISRVAKVVKGGRHLSFRALVVVGNGDGRVGVGLGKADAIPDAVRKGTAGAQKSMIRVPLTGTTIPHVVRAKYGAAYVLVKPAKPGTGIIAGASMRAVLELAGAQDVVAKSLGSQNPINVVRATLSALEQLSTAEVARPPQAEASQAPTS